MYDKIKKITEEGTVVQLTFTGTSCIVSMKEEKDTVMGNPVIVKKYTPESLEEGIDEYAAILNKADGEEKAETVGMENVGDKKKSGGKTTRKTEAKKPETAKEEPVDPKELKGPDPEKFKLPSEERRELFNLTAPDKPEPETETAQEEISQTQEDLLDDF